MKPLKAVKPPKAVRLFGPFRALLCGMPVALTSPASLHDVRAPVPPMAAIRAQAARPLQDATEILRRASERHRTLASLQASFTQNIRNPILEKEETSAGVFYFQAPLRYRIAFTRPPGDVVVSTGRDVWIYLPSSQPGQAIRSPVGDETKGFAPYQFIYDFKDRYEAALVGEERIGGRSAYHLVLSPRRTAGASGAPATGAEYARAEVWIDKESALTRQVEVVEEANGVVRRFTLEDHRPDVRLPASLFRFDPPAGVEVFDQ